MVVIIVVQGAVNAAMTRSRAKWDLPPVPLNLSDAAYDEWVDLVTENFYPKTNPRASRSIRDADSEFGQRVNPSRLTKTKRPNTMSHPVSAMRPGYGVNFRWRGSILNGINTYWLMVGIRIPRYAWIKHHQILTLNCSDLRGAGAEPAYPKPLARCERVARLIDGNKLRVERTQNMIQNLMGNTIHKLLPYFLDQEEVPQRLPTDLPQGYYYPEVQNKVIAKDQYFWDDDARDPPSASWLAFKGSNISSRYEDPVAIWDPHVGRPSHIEDQIEATRDGSIEPLLDQYKRPVFENLRSKRGIPPLLVKAIMNGPAIISTAKGAYNVIRSAVKWFKGFRQKRVYAQASKLMVERGRANTNRIERLDKAASALAELTDAKTRQLTKMIDDIRNSMLELGMVQSLSTMQNEYLIQSYQIANIHESLLAQAREMANGVQLLSRGYMDRTILDPADLRNMLQYVQWDLRINYPKYTLAFDTLPDYYSNPIGKAAYVGSAVLFALPVLIRHVDEVPMDVFHIETVPVPYNSDLQYPLENEKNPYTQLELDHDMVAMNNVTNMPLASADLQGCREIDHVYYCENMHLVKPTTTPTCAAAIFFDVSPEQIARVCPFKYYHELIPEPRVVDGGPELLLAGLPEPWTYICEENRDIPLPMKAGPYVVIKRSELCQCKIHAGEHFLQESLTTCQQEHADTMNDGVKHYFTINTAVAAIYGETSPSLTRDQAGFLRYVTGQESERITGSLINEEPYEHVLAPLFLKDNDPESNEDVLLDNHSVDLGVSLVDVVNATLHGETIYMEQNDLALMDKDPNTWFTRRGNYWFAIMMVLTPIGCISLVMVGCLAQQWAAVKLRIGRMATTMANQHVLMTALKAGGLVALAESSPIDPKYKMDATTMLCLSFKSILTFTVAQALMWAIFYITYRITRSLMKYFTTDYIEAPGQLMIRSWYTRAFDYQNTDIILQFSSMNQRVTRQVYVTTMPGHPALFTQKGTLKAHEIKQEYGCWVDVMTVPWVNIGLAYDGKLITLPSDLTIPVWCKKAIRKLMASGDTKVQILLLHSREYLVLRPNETPLVSEPTRGVAKTDSLSALSAQKLHQEMEEVKAKLPDLQPSLARRESRKRQLSVSIPAKTHELPEPPPVSPTRPPVDSTYEEIVSDESDLYLDPRPLKAPKPISTTLTKKPMALFTPETSRFLRKFGKSSPDSDPEKGKVNDAFELKENPSIVNDSTDSPTSTRPYKKAKPNSLL